MLQENYTTITTESVERLAHTLAHRNLPAIERFDPIANFEELITFTTENPTPVAYATRNPAWRLESVSARLVEAVAISVHEPTMGDAGWKVLAQIILEHTEYLYTYHQSHSPRERLQAGTALALVSSLCANLPQSNAWRLAGFARIAESITKIDDVPSYLIEPIDAAFVLARVLDLPIFGEAIDRYLVTFNRSFRWNKRTHFKIGDVEYFNNLNLRHPSVAKVKSEWEQGDLDAAKIAYATGKQSFLNSKIWDNLWQSPLRPSVVDSWELWSEQIPDSDVFHQKGSADVSRRAALELSKLVLCRPISAENRGAMFYDMAKSYLERAHYLSAYQGLDKADIHLETSIIGVAALLFPEWPDQEQFLKLALRRYEWIHDDHILPDGLQNDNLNTAHHFALICLLSFYQLACLCDFPLPQHFNRRCEKMIEAPMYLSQPDDRLRHWDRCDSTEISVSELCGVGQAVFHREDFLYMASSGAAGGPPNETSYAFPYSGYYVMRDNWHADAQYLVFDRDGSTTRYHRRDKLNFILYAFGRPLIIDGGGFIADHVSEGPNRRYNTVIIDGKGQFRSALRRAVRVPNPDANWLSTPSFDFVEGWHKDGYAEGNMFGCDSHLLHKRSIFYAKGNAQSGRSVSAEGGYFILHDLILGEGEHTLEQIFHLASVTCNRVEVYDNNMVCTVEPNVSNLAVAPVDDAENLDVRLNCGENETLVAGTIGELASCELTFAAKRTPPTVMNTVLIPLRPGVVTVSETRPIEVVADSDVLATGFTVTRERTTDLVLISDDGYAVISETDVEFVGEYLFLRLDENGKPQRVTIINGQFLKWRGEVMVELPEPQTYYESNICGE